MWEVWEAWSETHGDGESVEKYGKWKSTLSHTWYTDTTVWLNFIKLSLCYVIYVSQVCDLSRQGSVHENTHSTVRDWKWDPPGRGHISKHGGSGDPHTQTRHGGNHLKNTAEVGKDTTYIYTFIYIVLGNWNWCLTGAAPFTQMITLFLLAGTFL